MYQLITATATLAASPLSIPMSTAKRREKKTFTAFTWERTDKVEELRKAAGV